MTVDTCTARCVPSCYSASHCTKVVNQFVFFLVFFCDRNDGASMNVWPKRATGNEYRVLLLSILASPRQRLCCRCCRARQVANRCIEIRGYTSNRTAAGAAAWSAGYVHCTDVPADLRCTRQRVLAPTGGSHSRQGTETPGSKFDINSPFLTSTFIHALNIEAVEDLSGGQILHKSFLLLHLVFSNVRKRTVRHCTLPHGAGASPVGCLDARLFQRRHLHLTRTIQHSTELCLTWPIGSPLYCIHVRVRTGLISGSVRAVFKSEPHSSPFNRVQMLNNSLPTPPVSRLRSGTDRK
ncbi:hypothetical protein B0H17DRAFT_12483 [Mycena rosella]|uniref:Uncharacterized protein n=1 Tax=Mycena rosella TaxID=1033263 RepID=A0AAD7GSR4_MYCRO|nr:hypothetical protein B0H17DRAFT_12483 [Mycena rosella]